VNLPESELSTEHTVGAFPRGGRGLIVEDFDETVVGCEMTLVSFHSSLVRRELTESIQDLKIDRNASRLVNLQPSVLIGWCQIIILLN
jgi:hypothetical protein